MQEIRYWFIVATNIDKPNYTAHRDAHCPHLIKKNSKLAKLPKKVIMRKELGVHSPCTFCATDENIEWWCKGSEYFRNHMDKLRGYIKVYGRKK